MHGLHSRPAFIARSRPLLGVQMGSARIDQDCGQRAGTGRIRVNAICPGVSSTNFGALGGPPAVADPDRAQTMIARIPLGRWPKPMTRPAPRSGCSATPPHS